MFLNIICGVSFVIVLIICQIVIRKKETINKSEQGENG